MEAVGDVDLLDVQIELGTSLDEEDQEIFDEAVTLGHVGGSLAWDTRDDILAPTRGSFSTADLSLFAGPFGSQESFSKVFLSASNFRSTRNGIVFALLYSSVAAKYLPAIGGYEFTKGIIYGEILFVLAGLIYVPIFFRIGFFAVKAHPFAWTTSALVHGIFGLIVGWLAPVAA